jgi:hypothetical protein
MTGAGFHRPASVTGNGGLGIQCLVRLNQQPSSLTQSNPPNHNLDPAQARASLTSEAHSEERASRATPVHVRGGRWGAFRGVEKGVQRMPGPCRFPRHNSRVHVRARTHNPNP